MRGSIVIAMDEEMLERELRDYFRQAVRRCEPTADWWDGALERARRATSGESGGVIGVGDRVARWLKTIALTPWPVGALAVALIISVGAILWQAGVIGEVPAPEPTPIPAIAPTPTPRPTVVDLKVTPSQESYSPGEEVVLDFAFTNVDSVPVTIEPFPPAIDICREPLDGVVRSFVAGSDDATLLPGETLIHNVTWDQRDGAGEQVSPGRYHVSVGEFGTADWTVEYGWMTKLLIEWPQGAMEKTVYVDAERVVDGVGVALRRVEMERDGVSVIALTRLPEHYDASPPPSVPGVIPAPPPPEYFAPARAQYTVDDVVFDAGYAGFRGDSVADRVWLIWYGLDPVPADAVELTFSITALGDVGGPWEFTIPLD